MTPVHGRVAVPLNVSQIGVTSSPSTAIQNRSSCPGVVDFAPASVVASPTLSSSIAARISAPRLSIDLRICSMRCGAPGEFRKSKIQLSSCTMADCS